MKPMPLHRARHVDSDSIFVSENGHRMRKLSRYERFPKHAISQLVKGRTNDVADDVTNTS